MTTTLSFKKGKVLLREAPYAAAICEVSLASSCSYCFKDANVKACSKCRTISYCSKECRVSIHTIFSLQQVNKVTA